jgi:hypothetical protein
MVNGEFGSIVLVASGVIIGLVGWVVHAALMTSRSFRTASLLPHAVVLSFLSVCLVAAVHWLWMGQSPTPSHDDSGFVLFALVWVIVATLAASIIAAVIATPPASGR